MSAHRVKHDDARAAMAWRRIELAAKIQGGDSPAAAILNHLRTKSKATLLEELAAEMEARTR